MSTPSPAQPRRNLLIVVGNQRSGTTMLMAALDRCAGIKVFQEVSPVMKNFRLVSVEHLQATLATLSEPGAAIKPLCDSHWTDRILANIDGSRAVWMFRRWADVANSSVRKWPDHYLQIIERFRADDREWLGWRGERIADATATRFAELIAHVDDDVSAAAACWWLRNQQFFDVGLDEHPDVIRPVSYEPLVSAPAEWIQRIAEFGGLPFTSEMVEDVHARSIARDAAPSIPSELAAACDEQHVRLEESAQRVWSNDCRS